MGRPIKTKFFGNLNNEQFKNVGTNSGIGGEGVASVSISNTGTRYSQGAFVTFSGPDEPTGVIAQGHPVFTTNGNGTFGITSIVIDNPGSGYNTAPTITVTTATVVAAASTGNSGVTATNTFTVASVTGIYPGMEISGAATGSAGKVLSINSTLKRITTTVVNNGNWTNSANLTFIDYGTGFADSATLTTSQKYAAIKGNAYLLAKDGGSSAVEYDIVKQEAGHRYLVKTAQGIGQCRLVAAAPTAGQMTIIATDNNGNTYYVTKLTAHKAILTRQTQNGSNAWLYATSQAAKWTIGAAGVGVVSLAHTV
jgi:hypothetical protein